MNALNKIISYSSNKKIPFFKCYILAVLFFNLFPLQVKANSTIGDLELKAVDVNGNNITQFTAGQYVRVIASAAIKNLPKNATAKLSITAYFTTVVLGKKISYSFTLPANSLASSRINPIEQTADYGLPLGDEIQNSFYQETIDFQIPPQTPAGTLTLSVSATATSAKQIKRKFRFKIVR